MANIPADLRYTKEHEYVKQTGADAIVQIGITDYAQGELGDVVYVDLPKVGAVFGRGDVFGTIEAVKALSELYAPLAGTVTDGKDRKSTRLNSSHSQNSYAVFRLEKKESRRAPARRLPGLFSLQPALSRRIKQTSLRKQEPPLVCERKKWHFCEGSSLSDATGCAR